MLQLLLIFLVELAATQVQDPCTSYTELNDIRRSEGYSIDSSQHGLCDNGLHPGWFRFTNATGGRMPEHCVSKFQCGTTVPIWMKGTHPTQADGVVQRTVCANFNLGRDCCDSSLIIEVKNCGPFYVYNLQPTQACPVSYCAGDRVPCPTGQWSPTGFPPNCKSIPVMQNDPILRGPEVFNQGKGFRFTCNIDIPQRDPHQVFEVAWTFDDQEVANVTRQNITDPNRVAELDGASLKGHLGQEIQCKVRSFFLGGPLGVASEWRHSNKYWAGIKVEPAVLKISENGVLHNVTLIATIPTICDGANSGCCLTLVLDVNGPRDNMVANQDCQNDHVLCSAQWDSTSNTASTTFQIAAAKDQIKDGTVHTLLSFQQLGGNAAFGAYYEIFRDYNIPSIPVTVEDVDSKTCKWVTDPHVTGFSGNYFHLFNVGDYTMYENSDDYFEVQTRTFRCYRGVSCACGVAIRDKNAVIRISNCADRTSTPTVEVARGNLVCDEIVVERSTDGSTIVVTFPSGRQVKVETQVTWGKWTLNTYLAVPGSDMGHGRGICGTLDAVDTNEFTFRSGWTGRMCNRCVPSDFEESWRNTGNQSLFIDVPPEISVTSSNNRYCQCDTGTRRINCTVGGDVIHPILTVNGPTQQTGWTPISSPCDGTMKRSATYGYEDLDEADEPVDLDDSRQRRSDWTATWPTPGGITEDTARSRCLQELQKLPMWTHCQNMTEDIQNIIGNCMTDIQYSDSFDMVQMAAADLSAVCQIDVATQPSSYVTGDDGKAELKPVFTEAFSCSMLCLQHGHCDSGQCVCDAGYMGDSCQLEDGPPRLISVRGSSFCDINQKPCRKMYFNAQNFQMGSTLACKVADVLPNGQVSSDVVFEEAEFISNSRLACSLPDAKVKSDRSVKAFSVSVTSEGTMFSNSMTITVYDSSCHTCDDQQGCSQKANTCLIDDLCYQDGDVKKNDPTRVCRPSENTTQWTIEPTTVQLVDGSSAKEGRVEVLMNGTWGTVCDDYFDDNDASVVCYMFGYARSGAKARMSAYFGQGKGPILLDDVACTGQENSLRQCPVRPLRNHQCRHSEDAGVVCA